MCTTNVTIITCHQGLQPFSYSMPTGLSPYNVSLIALPQTPTFNNVETGMSTANVSWSHNSTCFKECQFEYMLSVAIGTDGHRSMMQQNIPYRITINNTQHLLSNLYSGTTYVVTLNAFCTTKGVWSAATSTSFTTVSFKQRTEGKFWYI